MHGPEEVQVRSQQLKGRKVLIVNSPASVGPFAIVTHRQIGMWSCNLRAGQPGTVYLPSKLTRALHADQ